MWMTMDRRESVRLAIWRGRVWLNRGELTLMDGGH